VQAVALAHGTRAAAYTEAPLLPALPRAPEIVQEDDRGRHERRIVVLEGSIGRRA